MRQPMEKPFYPAIRVEREHHGTCSYSIERLDRLTRTWVRAGKINTSTGFVKAVQGNLTLGELVALESGGLPMAAGETKEIQL